MCPHEKFDALVNVATVRETGERMVQIRIACLECRLPFEFQGLPIQGPIFSRPFKSFDGKEAYLPVRPFNLIVRE